MLARIVVVAVLAGTAACSGTSCSELAGLTAQRDAARERFAQVAARTASGPELDSAHDAMHALDTQVYALAQKC